MILHVDHTELTVSLLSEKTNCKTVCTMLQQLCVSVYIWLGSILIPPVNRTFAVTGRLYACPVHMASTRGWTPQTCLAWLMGLWLIAFNLNLCVCHSVHAHGGQKSPIAFHFAEAVSSCRCTGQPTLPWLVCEWPDTLPVSTSHLQLTNLGIPDAGHWIQLFM